MDGVKSYLLVLLDRSLGYEICNVGGETVQQNYQEKKEYRQMSSFLNKKNINFL